MCVICYEPMTPLCQKAQGFGVAGMTLMGASVGQAVALHPESQWLQAPAVDA
jgi:hypothetical protein